MLIYCSEFSKNQFLETDTTIKIDTIAKCEIYIKLLCADNQQLSESARK